MTDIITPDEYAKLTRRRGKYGNHRVQTEGYTFDSRAEANHFHYLKNLLADGKIADLRIHPIYILQDRFQAADGSVVRAITYIADFAYMERGREIVVDVKGVETAVFRLKRSLFLKRYPTIRLEIVRA